jgi:hypothetical protein
VNEEGLRIRQCFGLVKRIFMLQDVEILKKFVRISWKFVRIYWKFVRNFCSIFFQSLKVLYLFGSAQAKLLVSQNVTCATMMNLKTIPHLIHPLLPLLSPKSPTTIPGPTNFPIKSFHRYHLPPQTTKLPRSLNVALSKVPKAKTHFHSKQSLLFDHFRHINQIMLLENAMTYKKVTEEFPLKCFSFAESISPELTVIF